MASGGLSDDEFHRMQLQLLELRTQNYQLDDTCKRQTRDIDTFKQQVESLSKELQKANRTISKSKKAKEIESLSQDNEALQRKLISQEEDFRLQNETLMQELTTLVANNEKLEKEISSVPTTSEGSHETLDFNDELRRIQAQNSALQKNLTSQQEKYDEEILRLQGTIKVLQHVNNDLEIQCQKLAGQRGTPAGDENSDTRSVEGQSDNETSVNESGDPTELEKEDYMAKLRSTSINELMSDSELNSQKLQEQLKLVNEMKLSLDTEHEENKILKDQIANSQKCLHEQLALRSEEVEKLAEKLKKKQENFKKLQDEKEKMYCEFTQKLDESQKAKDEEIAVLIEQNTRMQDEIHKANKCMDDYKEKASKRIHELEDVVSSLNNQVDAASLETSLEEQNGKYQEQLTEMQASLNQSFQDNDDIMLQLKESQKACAQTLEQLHEAQLERDKQIQALQEMTKVAEKRKSLLDELVIKYQTETDHHRETIKTQAQKHTQEISDLNHKLNVEKEKTKELEKTKLKVEELKSSVASLEEAKGWLERSLKETEDLLTAANKKAEDDILKLKQLQVEAISQLEKKQSNSLQVLEHEIESLKAELDVKDQTIAQLEQEIKDKVEERKIHEKKGATLLKDLKRQLHSERKRAEKLQERLQEVLADPNKRQSMDDLFRASVESDRYKGDNSSISSWSASGFSRDLTPNTSINSPSSPNDAEMTSPGQLEQENNDLISRVSELQQEKWNFEERVAHLEASTAAMAEDLLQKTAVIEHYVMESRIVDVVACDHPKNNHPQSPSQEKITLKRVMDFVKDKGDENLKEMNRKLQRMLEETLTKNMHLEKDLETLSQEVMRLSAKDETK
ncbi:GRIP1-associated protein 1-like isoform X2 [Tubulanus polymorphus]|uniref:GRIP1-associated protein 1-like isoform X2 n=1 Tax=Tubulanus polymorphus TaxID=672921 RepID=UPI003DA3EA4D